MINCDDLPSQPIGNLMQMVKDLRAERDLYEEKADAYAAEDSKLRHELERLRAALLPRVGDLIRVGDETRFIVSIGVVAFDSPLSDGRLSAPWSEVSAALGEEKG